MEVLQTVSQVSSSTDFLKQQIEKIESGRAVEKKLSLEKKLKDEPQTEFQELPHIISDPSTEREEKKILEIP